MSGSNNVQDELSLQQRFGQPCVCFGCGPSNPKGLQIQSFVEGGEVIAHFTPEAHHNAFPGVLNGGIIGTLLDCHCNWAACWYLMQQQQIDKPPCTVTAEYTIKLRRPTPMGQELMITAKAVEISYPKAIIYGEIIVNGKVCDTCEGTFVAVDEGHPAYHRW